MAAIYKYRELDSKIKKKNIQGDIYSALERNQPSNDIVFTVITSVPKGSADNAYIKPEEKNILIVEDSKPNIFIMEMILSKWGYKIDTASSGEEALRKVESAFYAYHAILMDIQMSTMDGYETTRKIRELEKLKGQKNYIIGVTAHALAENREKSLESGMDDYMTKPVQFDMLEQKLRCGYKRIA